MVPSVWPGIGELRTTAFRTGLYAGREPTEWGSDRELSFDGATIVYPEWAQVTVHRLDRHGNARAYPGPRVYWLESYATAGRDTVAPNEMWRRRTRGQLDKCAEAAALRAAFPEEIGNDYAAEEMEGQIVDHGPEAPPLAENGSLTTGNQALRARLGVKAPAVPEEDAIPDEASDAPLEPAPEAEEPPAATRRRRQPKPTEAEIERSQAGLAAVAKLDDPVDWDTARSGGDGEPDHDLSVLVSFDPSSNVQEWFGRARERLREMQTTRLTPDRFVAFRKANQGALMRLRGEFASYAEQLDGIISTGERGGAALGYKR
jgi:hypothetical protein